jgi:hypothetical protein
MQWSAWTNLRQWQILSWDSESPGQQMYQGPPNYKMTPSSSITVLITEIWLHYCNNQWKTPPQWCQSLKVSCRSAKALHEIAAESKGPQAAPNQKINHPILKHSKSYCRANWNNAFWEPRLHRLQHHIPEDHNVKLEKMFLNSPSTAKFL